MTATPEIIPSDLALEIGDNPSPERFMAAARAFFGYVQEIGRMMAPESDLPDWVVQVRDGSAVLAVVPAPSVSATILNAVYSKAESGIRDLRDHDIDEAGLSDGALKHLRVLADLTEGPRGRPMPLRLWVRRKPVDVDAGIARVIQENWRVDYNDFGTIEGRLETIQDKEGSLQLQIRDAALRQTVRSYFQEEMLPKAFEMFRRRVEVSGIIHYRRNGTPVSIEASHIEGLPDDSELPSVEDVRGILAATQ